ncbi:hypothetical protein JOF56_009973 [Kibdelosporangium banguiense]|uniref:Uncharacterized protein n=1 Tax=Kibdelosporangium banguiense TaxID=1365924 RepID=A0ABS4U023_9PSEU|nr:hypothetical protein [Kibdelosporangium banguiense]
MGHLWDALGHAYDELGFDAATDGDEVLRSLVLARIIEPTSKLDLLRVLDEAGIAHRRMRRSSAVSPRLLSGPGGTPWPRRARRMSACNPGPPDPPTNAVTRSSITNAGPTAPAAPCAGSTSRSPRSRKPSRARRR